MGSGGGGIYSDRMLTLTRSTLIGNSVVREMAAASLTMVR